MKKIVLGLLLLSMLYVVTGCASTGTKKKVNSEEDIKRNQQLLNEFRETAKNPIYVKKCGNSLDPLCDSCNTIYDRVAKHNVEVFEKLRGNEFTEELTRSFWDGSKEDEVKKKATELYAGFAESDKEKYNVDTMVANAKEQFCFESYTGYKEELKAASNDAARNEITNKAKADAEYWARLEAGKAAFEKRFNKDTCEKYVGTCEALKVAVKEASQGIAVAGQNLIKKISDEAKPKIAAEKARLEAQGVTGVELFKAMKEISKPIMEQVKKETASIKDILAVAKKQAAFEFKTIAWCEEQVEIMKSYNE